MTPDLFDPPRARTDDPVTSHAAARRVSEFAASHYGLILLALKDHGPATIYELAERTKLSHVAIARRLPELDKRLAVRVTDAMRPSPTGRLCRAWAAV